MWVQMYQNIAIEEFKTIVLNANSMRSASKELNIPFSTFKRIAISLNIYKTNQSGVGLPKGETKNIEKLNRILSGAYNPYISGNTLKTRLVKYGLINNKCSICGLSNTWNDKPLMLQMDHIDGNNRNNKKENLRILCPNCHTQTPTYTGRNKTKKNKADYSKLQELISNNKPQNISELCSLLGIRKAITNFKKINIELLQQQIKTDIQLKCLNCNTHITDKSKSGYCNKCSHILQYRTEHPSKERLLTELKISNPYALGKKYGVSDNAIRHWMKGYDIPTKKNELKEYLASLPT